MINLDDLRTMGCTSITKLKLLQYFSNEECICGSIKKTV